LKYRLISALITRRHELHLTQQQLAARAGVAQAEISRIERGRKSPTLDTFAILAVRPLLPDFGPIRGERAAEASQLHPSPNPTPHCRPGWAG
jgi:transcriptional regulator with XRE-family HTH domain